MSSGQGTVYVAGHRGLVGSGIVRALEGQGRPWIGRTRAELDLTDRSGVFDFVAGEKPEEPVWTGIGAWDEEYEPGRWYHVAGTVEIP